MSGNVWEWTLSAYETTHLDLDSAKSLRVIRGGSWGKNLERWFRVAVRYWELPVSRGDHVGLRLARS